jgi:hypothetical protein
MTVYASFLVSFLNLILFLPSASIAGTCDAPNLSPAVVAYYCGSEAGCDAAIRQGSPTPMIELLCGLETACSISRSRGDSVPMIEVYCGSEIACNIANSRGDAVRATVYCN